MLWKGGGLLGCSLFKPKLFCLWLAEYCTWDLETALVWTPGALKTLCCGTTGTRVGILLNCTGIPALFPTECEFTTEVGCKWTLDVGKFKLFPFKLEFWVSFVFKSENHTALSFLVFSVVPMVGRISGVRLGISVTGTFLGASLLTTFFARGLTKVALSCTLEVDVPLPFLAAWIFFRWSDRGWL